MDMCPGCARPVSEMERLLGVCAKDGQPLSEPRVEIELYPADRPSTEEVMAMSTPDL